MSKKRVYDPTEQKGIIAVQMIFNNILQWIFRPQPIGDYGIDAHVETSDKGGPSGRLIGLQIKSGPAYFREKDKVGYVYRGDMEHLSYWFNHSLPVVLVLYDPNKDMSYWQIVRKENVKLTKKQWKMIVPFNQTLDKTAKKMLRELAEGPPSNRRFTELSLAKPWMEIINQRNRLLLEAEEWVNKSSGRGSLRLLVQDEDGNEETVADWPFVMFPGLLYVEVFPQLFPWASLSIDEDFYEEYDQQEYDSDCGVWDGEDQKYIFHTETFEEWKKGLARIRPYEEAAAGEVARFRLELTLNRVGKAFLTLDRYLSTGKTGTRDITIPGIYGSSLKFLARKYNLTSDKD